MPFLLILIHARARVCVCVHTVVHCLLCGYFLLTIKTDSQTEAANRTNDLCSHIQFRRKQLYFLLSMHTYLTEKRKRGREYKRTTTSTRSYVRQTERTCAAREETMRWWSSRLEIIFARGQREIPKPWYVCHLQRHSLLSNPSMQSETEIKEERRESDSPDGLFSSSSSLSENARRHCGASESLLAFDWHLFIDAWRILLDRSPEKRIRLHHVEGKRRTPVILFGIYHHLLVWRRSFLTVNAFSLRVCVSRVRLMCWSDSLTVEL